MKTVTSDQMRELDRRTIEEAGVPGEILMERAGVGAGELILEYCSNLPARHVKRFIILAGKGNNGGDGYVIARFLSERTDLDIIIYSVCEKSDLKGDALLNAERIPSCVQFFVKGVLTSEDFKEGDIIIDGLLGTGISGPLRQPYDNWLAVVNEQKLPVIALDIPSGLNGDDGLFETDCILADLTITMGLPKKGLVLGHGPAKCGRLRCIDIGIPADYISELPDDLNVSFGDDFKALFERLPMNSHKGSRGRVLIVGGSRFYPGAPFLAGKAALRTSAGLVTVAIPGSVSRFSMNDFSLIPRFIDDDGKGVLNSASLPELEILAESADCIVFGPGISTDDSIFPVLEFMTRQEKPIVLDADALNLIAKRPEVLKQRTKGETVLTPHPGEMKRLLKAFKLDDLTEENRISRALALAEVTEAIVALKGHRTVIASLEGAYTVNSSGSPALATAGSGDVLSGMTATLLAQNIAPFRALSAAVFIHGLTGELSPYGLRGLMADDIPDIIPDAVFSLSPFA